MRHAKIIEAWKISFGMIVIFKAIQRHAETWCYDEIRSKRIYAFSEAGNTNNGELWESPKTRKIGELIPIDPRFEDTDMI